MSKPMTHERVVEVVNIAKIHLDCAAASLEAVAGKLEAQQAPTPGIEQANLRYAIDGLAALALSDIFPDCIHALTGVPLECGHPATDNALRSHR